MSSRTIFEGLKLFKKEVSERFLLVTREIYTHHPAYPYLDDAGKSSILIYPSYADTDSDGKQARMVVKVGAYNLSLLDTFNSNMSKEIFTDGVLTGYRHDQFISVTMTILVQSYAEEESSDLADELSSLITIACLEMYRGAGFVIRGTQVSETDLYDREKKVYQTSVTMTADVPWSWTKESKTKASDEAVLEIINDPLIVEGYRPPGAYVVQQKETETPK